MRYSPAVIKTELLCGLTVSLALVPEAVSFAFAAGVDPKVGLYTSFMIGLIIAVFGGRPAVVSGSAGAIAVVVVSVVLNHGLEYLYATVILAGLFQILIGALHIGRFIRLVPYPALLGFVNGLSVVIIAAQFKQLQVDGAWLPMSELQVIVPLILLTMFICLMAPRLTKAAPGPLIGIVSVTALVVLGGIDTRTVGDLAAIGGGFPAFHIPNIPLTFDAYTIIFPMALVVAGIGAIEQLLLLNIVGDMTGTRGNVQREVYSLGLANVVNGFFGGMGGCASIGQSMINVSSGARYRLSTITGVCLLLFYVLAGSNIIEMIPIAALVGVMFFVMIRTFVWASFKLIGRVPLVDTTVMLMVTVITILTDIATAVIIGAVLSALAFAWKSASQIHLRERFLDDKGFKVYLVEGPLFFASAQRFKEMFMADKDPEHVIIDFADCRVIDQSGIEAIDSLADVYMRKNKQLHIRHLSADCAELLTKASRFIESNDNEDPHYGLVIDYKAQTKI